MDQIIRTATLADLDAVAAVEAACFPAAEAATRAELADRLAHYGGHFWLMFDGGTLIAFVDGMVTDRADLTDDRLPAARLCGAAPRARHCRRPRAGAARPCAHVQGPARALLCEVRLRE